MPTHTSLPFFKFGFAGCPQNQTRKKGNIHFIRVTPDGASLVWGYYPIVPVGLQFGSLCSHSWQTKSAATPGQRCPMCRETHSRHWLTRLVGCIFHDANQRAMSLRF